MKHKLIGDNDFIFDPIGTIFANRGIDNYETYTNLTDGVLSDYKRLKNIDLALDVLIKHINNSLIPSKFAKSFTFL